MPLQDEVSGESLALLFQHTISFLPRPCARLLTRILFLEIIRIERPPSPTSIYSSDGKVIDLDGHPRNIHDVLGHESEFKDIPLR